MNLCENTSSKVFVDHEGNVGIGTTSPQEKLDVKGNIRTTPTSGDSYPTSQLFNYSHDNISLNFDSWWDGSWKSSDSGSNFRIYKIGDKLRISYASGVTAGDTIYAWASENDNCALAVDSSGNLGIGTPAPVSKLELNGSVGFKITSASNDYIAADDAIILVSSPKTIKLPSAASVPGRMYFIKKVDSSSYVTIECDDGGDLIDGQSSIYVNTTYGGNIVVSDGVSNWYTVAMK
jgi:hypothetical protein